MADLIAWAERFVATPSESLLGNEAIASLAAELLVELGLPARIESARVAGTRHHAVICDVGPASGSDGLLLVTHLDTVPPGEHSAWTATGGDPFRPTRDGDRLYGLGSADAKVDFACKAHALAKVERARLRRPVRLVGTFGEEVGLIGARWLIERGLARGFRDALIGEPSELTAVHAHKGYAVFEARVALARLDTGPGQLATNRVVLGAAAHSSAPSLGVNAILAALRRMGFQKEEMTGHGFRSMASTILNEQGWHRDAIERQLAHAERNKVRDAYNYAEYLPERRKMMQAWADYLDGLKQGAEVIPIRSPKAGRRA